MADIHNRLSINIHPLNYNIFIRPNIQDFTFYGKVEIEIDISNDTNTIDIHSKNITYETILYDNIPISNSYNPINEMLSLHNQFIKGKHTLVFVYTGIINNNMIGFYRSSYINNDITKYMFVTQFEPTDARQAFPCFDEPSFKAYFNITLSVPNNLTALSNTSIKETHKDIEYPNNNIVVFNTCPLMSSYLVAFIIGELTFIQKYTKHNTRVRIYSQPNHKAKLDFALDIACKAQELLTDWFDVPYSLDKIDHVAIDEFGAGAMENWGLITYRLSYLLIDEDNHNYTIDDKINIVYTICHELAHQWFGNLVSIKWWTYLWLNETMATYFGWMITDMLFPKWKVWNRFLLTELFSALELDSLENSHPIEVEINNSRDINSIFDAISYSKGSCLIRFLVNYIGIIKFQNGMRQYIKNNMYKSISSSDLWPVFGSDIQSLMNVWIKQVGYPVLYIGRDLISQSRFYKHNKDNYKDNYNKELWHIPLKINNTYVIFKDVMKKCKLICNPNPNYICFYRIYYNDVLFDNLTIQDKIQILIDTFALTYSGKHSFTYLFSLFDKFDIYNSNNYYVLKIVLTNMMFLYKNLNHDPDIQVIFVSKCIEPFFKQLLILYNKLGWKYNKSEPIEITNFRLLLIYNLGFYGNKQIIDLCLEDFRNDTYYDKRNIIFSLVGLYGKDTDYNKLLYLLKQDNINNNYILEAIGSFNDINLLNQSIELLKSDIIKDQDLLYYINSLINNNKIHKIRPIVFGMWDKLLLKYPNGSSGLTYLIKSMAGNLVKSHHLNMYMDFFSELSKDISVKQAKEQILFNNYINKSLIEFISDL